jgi:hypothetical protein
MVKETLKNEDLLRIVEDYCSDRSEFYMTSLDIVDIGESCGELYLRITTIDKRTPELFMLCDVRGNSRKRVIPYFLVQERPDRQIISYYLGRNICNLSEVREINGRLYSRYADSYEPDELPHQEETASKIALWVHDCLTEDFDHHSTLNRHDLPFGASISYDFGMSFSNSYFPPFYAWELGISDDSIRENADFVVELLTRYARLVEVKEESVISRVRDIYPTTVNEGFLRYLFRSYKTYFPMRLYYGRIFDKLKSTGLRRDKLSAILGVIGIPVEGADDWRYLVQLLTDNRRRSLDLRGLDLSHVNMRRADLFGADLRESDLTGADLGGSDLRYADLRGAKTEGMDIDGARTEGIRI